MIGNLFKNVAGALSGAGSGARPGSETSFTGRWHATFGVMDLQQEGDRVHGSYGWGEQASSVEGHIEDGKLVFQYQEPAARGEGWFRLVRAGKFQGQWRQEGDERWHPWIGERGYDGVWDSTFGLLRLMDEGARVIGFYEGLGSATVEGQMQDGRLTFRYQEPRAGGEGQFTLAEDGMSFAGQWRQDGAIAWQPWLGKRLSGKVGHIWLVVIEAHWQRHLMDKEYSFGNMLREFFARVPHIQFSHRFFSNEEGLRQWCRDVMYIPDPVVVVLASHGTAEGLAVRGQTISPQAVSESLRYADNIQLLHLSSCLTMQDGSLVRELTQHLRIPISGYTTSVDWAASAITEFTYLDLILRGPGARGCRRPVDAALELRRRSGLSWLRVSGGGVSDDRAAGVIGTMDRAGGSWIFRRPVYAHAHGERSLNGSRAAGIVLLGHFHHRPRRLPPAAPGPRGADRGRRLGPGAGPCRCFRRYLPGRGPRSRS